MWVNLGGTNSAVFNEFLDSGQKITWFGGSQMHDDTPVEQRLLTLGQVSYHGVRDGKQNPKALIPMCALDVWPIILMSLGCTHFFVWKLLDIHAIQKHSDEAAAQCRFQQCISEALLIV
jgi:hypothetical protein